MNTSPSDDNGRFGLPVAAYVVVVVCNMNVNAISVVAAGFVSSSLFTDVIPDSVKIHLKYVTCGLWFVLKTLLMVNV